MVKVNKAREFLEHKDKVIVSVVFRGRELAHIDEGRKVLNEVLAKLEDVCKIEPPPQHHGRGWFARSRRNRFSIGRPASAIALCIRDRSMLEPFNAPPQPTPSPALHTTWRVVLGAVFIFLLSLGMVTSVFLPTMYRERLGWVSLTLRAKHTLSSASPCCCRWSQRFQAISRGGLAHPSTRHSAAAASSAAWPPRFPQASAGPRFAQHGKHPLAGLLRHAVAFSRHFHRLGWLHFQGMAAIVVRDRRRVGRARLIRSSLYQEVFIVFTIASVIISAMTSIAALRCRDMPISG